MPAPDRDKGIREAAESLTKEDPERQAEVEQEIRGRPFTLLSEGLPGSQMFEIEHLGSNAIVKLRSTVRCWTASRKPLHIGHAPFLGYTLAEHDRGLAEVMIRTRRVALRRSGRFHARPVD